MSSWADALRQLVVISLIAALIDLLIPSGGMKKYVRLVTGLLIMLLLLRPIASLFLGGAADEDVVMRLLTMND
ncbi:MAG: stage III sporulation protein AF [Oscillospiraceae bacterium]|jgi:stage III sporulation protein AF|nr:stage III sporulation protein AF [Oscillospiraceae bacterium]